MEYHCEYYYEKYGNHYAVIRRTWASNVLPTVTMKEEIVCHCDTIEECEMEIAELEVA